MRLDCGLTVNRAWTSSAPRIVRESLAVHAREPRADARRLPESRADAAARSRAGVPVARPTGSTSPARSARPPNGPMRLTRCVARLPSVAGTSNPPRTASVIRVPFTRAPHRRRAPDCTRNGSLPRDRRAVDRHVDLRAGHRARQVAVGHELRPEQRDLERRGHRIVAEHLVGQPVRIRVHRTRDRHAKPLVARAPRSCTVVSIPGLYGKRATGARLRADPGRVHTSPHWVAARYADSEMR